MIYRSFLREFGFNIIKIQKIMIIEIKLIKWIIRFMIGHKPKYQSLYYGRGINEKNI